MSKKKNKKGKLFDETEEKYKFKSYNKVIKKKKCFRHCRSDRTAIP